jgi:pimeloyl-ACP methyl ester carboxylesterase
VRGVGAAALAATITAATIIAALITGDGGGPLGTAPGPPTGLAHLLAAAASAGLIVGAHALWQGSRRAAVIIAPALVGLGVAGVAEGRVLPSAVALAGAAALVAARNSFRLGGARSGARPPSIILAATVTEHLLPGRHDWRLWRAQTPTMVRWASQRPRAAR